MRKDWLQPTADLQGRPVAATLPTDGQALTWNDTNKRWQPGTPTGGGIGPVSAQASSPVTVNSSDSGKVYTNEGATGEIVFNLPTAAANLFYTFVVQDSDGVEVVANTGDTIRLAGSVSASAGKIESATIGSSVTIIAINATEWVAMALMGSWTVT